MFRRDWALLGLILYASTTFPVRAASADQLQTGGVKLRVMQKGYEFYMERGNLTRAEDYLDSILGLTKVEAAKAGMEPEQFFVTSGAGTAQTWRTLQSLSDTSAGHPHSSEGGPIITDCHRDGDNATCLTSH